MSKKILVAIGPSSISDKVLAYSDKQAMEMGAELFILHVEETYPYLPDPKKPFENFMAKQNIQSKHTVLTPLGSPGPKIMEEAIKIKPDLIVMADHSHNFIERVFLGGTANYVLHYSNFPVYIYKDVSGKLENTILVPFDFSDISFRALKVADKLANGDSELYVVHVNPHAWDYSDWGAELYGGGGPVEEKIKEEDEQLHIKLKTSLKNMGLASPDNSAVKRGVPHEEIVSLQKELNPKLMVFSAHSYTLMQRMLVGGTANYILNHADCPLYVHKE